MPRQMKREYCQEVCTPCYAEMERVSTVAVDDTYVVGGGTQRVVAD